MKRILVLTDHLDEDPCYRLRIRALIAPLRACGFDWIVRVRPKGWLARRRLAGQAAAFDAVVINYKLLTPGEYRLLHRSGRPLFYDVGDAVWHLARRQNWLIRWRLRRRLQAAARYVDHVVAGNEHVADVFRQQGRPVSLVPTVVAPADYPLKAHAPTETPRLSWIGTAPNLPYLREIFPALAEARRQVPGLRLLIICDRSLPDAPLPVDFQPWALATEAADLARGDIGVAPTPLNPWTLGKSGFKIIQYMAAALPVIASPVGANSAIVRADSPDPTGFLPTDHDAWVRALVTLAQDVTLRARLGQAGRRRVEAHYNLTCVIAQWATLLPSAPEPR